MSNQVDEISVTAVGIGLVFTVALIGAVATRAPADPTSIASEKAFQARQVRHAEPAIPRSPRAVLEVDAELGLHTVVGHKHHYFAGGRYYRVKHGAWLVSLDMENWRPVKHARVPRVLRARYAAKSK